MGFEEIRLRPTLKKMFVSIHRPVEIKNNHKLPEGRNFFFFNLFDDQIGNICKKDGAKLNALTRVAQYMITEKST